MYMYMYVCHGRRCGSQIFYTYYMYMYVHVVPWLAHEVPPRPSCVAGPGLDYPRIRLDRITLVAAAFLTK